MKKDAENNEKEVLQGKNALSDVVQVNFAGESDVNKEAGALTNLPVKDYDMSSSKQEFLKEIERLGGIIKSKDAEIKRLNSKLEGLLDIEEKKEESIAIHKRAVDALADAVREAEKIIENAKKVANKISKGSSNSFEIDAERFSGSGAYKSVTRQNEETKTSVAEETIKELMQIRNGSYKDDDNFAFRRGIEHVPKDSEKIKFPGADHLVVSEDILTADFIGVNEPAGINIDEVDDFLSNVNSGDRALFEGDDSAIEDAKKEAEQSEKSDEVEKRINEKKKSGWFLGFPKRK